MSEETKQEAFLCVLYADDIRRLKDGRTWLVLTDSFSMLTSGKNLVGSVGAAGDKWRAWRQGRKEQIFDTKAEAEAFVEQGKHA